MTEEAYLEKKLLYNDYTRQLVMMEITSAIKDYLKRGMSGEELEDYLKAKADNIILRVTNANKAIEESFKANNN
jgi:hypothetical protein